MALNPSKLLIDGQLVDAEDTKTYDNLNPATEEVIGQAADGTVGDMDRAIDAARRSFEESGWRDDPKFRASCIRQLHAGLTERKEEMREVIISEVGAPYAVTTFVQVEPPIEDLLFIADLAENYEYEQDMGERDTLNGPAHRIIQREAIGVVGAITPWNFPLLINLAKVAPALAAGTSVVLKPAPDTPWTAALLGEIVKDNTDIPDGVFNVVTSSDHEVGARLSSHPDVDMVTFTGSTATGRRIMQAASATIKRTFLELGGKSANIILDDANFDEVIPAVVFPVGIHAGQGCALTTRLLLPRSRYEEGVELARLTFESYPYGDPRDPGNFMGPVISAVQRDRVLEYMRIGAEEGRIVVGGGKADQFERGYFVQPTIIADVDPDARVAQEEIFGPVITVIAYDDDDDAVRIANNSMYGLSGAVHSADVERATAVARRVRTGTMSVNGALWLGADVPFGGYKQSGIGRENGLAGFEEYLETKTIGLPI